MRIRLLRRAFAEALEFDLAEIGGEQSPLLMRCSGRVTFMLGAQFQDSRNLLYASEDLLLFTADTATGTTPFSPALPSGVAWEEGEATPPSPPPESGPS